MWVLTDILMFDVLRFEISRSGYNWRKPSLWIWNLSTFNFSFSHTLDFIRINGKSLINSNKFFLLILKLIELVLYHFLYCKCSECYCDLNSLLRSSKCQWMRLKLMRMQMNPITEEPFKVMAKVPIDVQ